MYVAKSRKPSHPFVPFIRRIHTVTLFGKTIVFFTFLMSGDMLGGHLDDMEADRSKPIVSMR